MEEEAPTQYGNGRRFLFVNDQKSATVQYLRGERTSSLPPTPPPSHLDYQVLADWKRQSISKDLGKEAKDPQYSIRPKGLGREAKWW